MASPPMSLRFYSKMFCMLVCDTSTADFCLASAANSLPAIDWAHLGSLSFCAPKFRGVAGSELSPETSALEALEYFELYATSGSFSCGAESRTRVAPFEAMAAPSI